MTNAMYQAILEIAENGERFKAHDLNVAMRTVKALAKRGYIYVIDGHAFVSPRAWKAIEEG